MEKLKSLRNGDILAVKAPFEVAPLLDAARGKGYLTWVNHLSSDEVVNYIFYP
jgi:hypothetical protein